MTTTRMRVLFGVLAIAALSALAAACGSSSSSSTPTANATSGASATAGTSPAASPTSAIQMGGSITIQGLQFQSFDPHYSGFSQDIAVERMVWRGLYRLDKDNKLQPEMAASQPTVSSDGLTYTVKLQSGLKWSDGTPMTAKDFVAGIVRTCAPDTAGYYQNFLFSIVGCSDYSAATKATAAEKLALQAKLGVSAPDDTTIVFKLAQAQATFGTQLAMWYTFPVPTAIVKDPATDKWPAPTALAFNGPYKVQSYTEKDNIVLVKNDNYQSASSHKAYLDKITMKYIENTEQADNAFRAGQLDFALANTAQITAIKSDPSTKDAYFQDPQVATTQALEMNLKHAPLDNLKVRLALSQAIDRKQLVQVISSGVFIPTTSWIPGDLIGIAQDPFETQIGFNATAAKQNLADAGYPNGKGFPTLDFMIRDTPANKAMAAFVQNSFKTILNININISTVDSKTRSSNFSSGKFDLLPGGWIQDYPDPEDWVDGQFNTGGSQNFWGCSNPQIDSLFAKAKVNQNNTERLSQYKQINEIISTTMCGVAPLYNQSAYYLINTKLHGMRSNSTSQDAVAAADWTVESWWLAK